MTIAERNHLVVAHLPEVRKIAYWMRRKLPKGVDVEDLVQVGTIGLMRATERFDPAKKTKFSTYSARRVIGAILDYLRDINWQPRLSKRRGEVPPCVGRLPFFVAKGEELDLVDESVNDPSFEIEQQDELDWMTRSLDSAGKQMVIRHFVDGLTMKEVGRELDYSESRVSQRLAEFRETSIAR